MTALVIFDDGRGEFGPMTDLRASFELRTGMLTTAGRIVAHRSEQLCAFWTPPRLRELVVQRANIPVNELPDADDVLCINGRLTNPDTTCSLAPGDVCIDAESSDVIACLLKRSDAQAFLDRGDLPSGASDRSDHGLELYKYPWDILNRLPDLLPQDILSMRMTDATLTSDGIQTIGDHPVQIHPTARVLPGAIFDAQNGPIIVHEGATIRPYAVLIGPCSIGRDSTILDHALAKAHTVVGPVCKIAGEVGGTIFQGYSNKSHDGHLGDSWVGKWVNFGAGTTNSNLLNTYGEIPMKLEPDGQRHGTGRRYLGAIVGDHAKFAIGTQLMTGCVVGTGAMIASSTPPPSTVRRFAWLTDRGEQTFRFDKFIETARAMMARRDKAPSESYVELLKHWHPDARHETR